MKITDEKKYHQKYLEWKKDYKKGKKAFYISNVIVPDLITTAIFAIALAILNLTLKKFDAFAVVGFSLLFFAVYGVISFLIYLFFWKNSEKQFTQYELELNKKLLEKINNGDIEDKDNLKQKLENLIANAEQKTEINDKANSSSENSQKEQNEKEDI